MLLGMEPHRLQPSLESITLLLYSLCPMANCLPLTTHKSFQPEYPWKVDSYFLSTKMVVGISLRQGWRLEPCGSLERLNSKDRNIHIQRDGGVAVQQQPNKRTKYVQWVPSLKGKDGRNGSCLEGTGCGYNYIGNWMTAWSGRWAGRHGIMSGSLELRESQHTRGMSSVVSEVR